MQALLEDASQRDYFAEHGRSLLSDYAAAEETQGKRLIYANDGFLVLVPFWAVWPFEGMILSRRHVGAVSDLDDAERDQLADAIRQLTVRYDNIFETSFPYSMGLHQRPTLAGSWDHWHFHMHFYPPLLRSASVRKFLVGYEMLGTPQRDITPEQAATRIREQASQHYTQRDG